MGDAREKGPLPRPEARKKGRGRAPLRAKSPSPGRDDFEDALMNEGILEPRIIGKGFDERVYAVVKLVPKGRVTTYGDVGTVLGSARIARQVGWALSRLAKERSEDVPWHRVVNAKGMVSYRGDLGRAGLQEALLREEGIEVDEKGRLALQSYRYDYPSGPLLSEAKLEEN